ncbi:MAG: DUF4265 domain-containing protein, partial [Actinomycetota bacterium]
MSDDRTSDRVKVRFNLQADDDSWPPVESEGLWAEPIGGDEYRVDNTPWFVQGVAADDVVRALAGSDGVLWAIAPVRWSGRLTIRVIPRADGQLRGDRQAVLDTFGAHGVTGEGIEQYGMVALDIPADADFPYLKSLLVAGEADGRW